MEFLKKKTDYIFVFSTVLFVYMTCVLVSAAGCIVKQKCSLIIIKIVECCKIM